jgi:hypothetical protein
LEAENPEDGTGADPILIGEDPNIVDLDTEIGDGLDGEDGALDFDQGKYCSHSALHSLRMHLLV